MYFIIPLAVDINTFYSQGFCSHALGTAVYQTSLRHLPPVLQKSVKQPSTSLGADLRHHRSHHNTGASQDNKVETKFLQTQLCGGRNNLIGLKYVQCDEQL